MSSGIKHMLVATLFFSLMNLLVKYVPHIPSVEVVFFRCLISLVITAVVLKRQRIPMLGNNKPLLILRGVFGIIALTMYFTTLQQLPLASAVTIQYLSPVFASLVAVFFLKERVTPLQILFMLLSFVGVAMIKGFDERIAMKFLVIGILAALFSGIAYNIVRRLKDSDHPWVVVLYFPLIGAPVTGVLSMMNWVRPSLWDLAILLGIGVFTQIAQVQMTKALQSEAIARVSSIRYLGVIYALVLGFAFFGERYGVLTLVGILLVVAGVVLNLIQRQRTKVT